MQHSLVCLLFSHFIKQDTEASLAVSAAVIILSKIHHILIRTLTVQGIF